MSAMDMPAEEAAAAAVAQARRAKATLLGDTARLLKGQLIASEVYCPEELEEFQDCVDDLESEDVTEG